MPLWKRNLFVCWFGSFATMVGLSQITPILPLYIEELGVHGTAIIEQWSGIAYGVTFIISAVISPIWGRLADKYGRKLMLIRASLGMAIIITIMGVVQNIYELVGLRLLMGAISGYISASITLIATQTPKERSGWALGILSTGTSGGMLLGSLFGGYLAETMGLRSVFYASGALLLIAAILSLLFIQEQFTSLRETVPSFHEVWNLIPNYKVVISMVITTFFLQLALMLIQPIITVYVTLLSQDTTHIILISSMAVSASGLASMLVAPRLGKISDNIGAQKLVLATLVAAGILFIPQAFVQSPWQLIGLRFLLGISTAGLLPSINVLIKQNTPNVIIGRIFGYNQSAQFLGIFGGSVMGGQMAAYFGIHYVFFFASILLLTNALWVYKMIYVRKI